MLVGSTNIFSETEELSSPDTLEDRAEQMCSLVEGVGECEVMITYGDDDSVYAVAVLCEGADRTQVRKSVTELITSLFGIGTNRISILKISK